MGTAWREARITPWSRPMAPLKKPARKRPAAKRISPAERQRVAVLFDRFESLDLHPKTELYYSNPYTLVTAVALSAQATDVQVNKATGPLFAVADSAEKMLELGEAELTRYIASIGLFRSKAKNVMAAARILVEQHGGEVPLNRADLENLPGVGRKTASVVLNELDVEPAIAVDTHVFRVSHRLKLSLAKTPTPTTYNAVGQTISYSYVVQNTGNVTISGNITNNASTNLLASSLTKSGSGALTLSGTNTYTGNTTVNSATLKLSAPNTNNQSSTVNIAATGATLELDFAGSGPEARGAVNLPDIKDRLKDLGSDGVGNAPEEFGRFVADEHAKYGKLIKSMGIKAE